MDYIRNRKKKTYPRSTEMKKKIIRESVVQFYVNKFGNTDEIADFLEKVSF